MIRRLTVEQIDEHLEKWKDTDAVVWDMVMDNSSPCCFSRSVNRTAVSDLRKWKHTFNRTNYKKMDSSVFKGHVHELLIEETERLGIDQTLVRLICERRELVAEDFIDSVVGNNLTNGNAMKFSVFTTLDALYCHTATMFNGVFADRSVHLNQRIDSIGYMWFRGLVPVFDGRVWSIYGMKGDVFYVDEK